MSDLVVDLDHPIEGPKGKIDKVVFTAQPTAKHLIEHGPFLTPGLQLNFGVLAIYIDDLTDLSIGEIERLHQVDFGKIGQKLADWVFTDEKK